MRRTTDVIPGQLRERNQRQNWNGLEKCKSLVYILAKKFQKQRKMSCIPVYFPSYFRAPKHGHCRRRNRRYSKLVSGRWNGECYMERQSDECWNTEHKNHDEHDGSGWESKVEMSRPCGRRAQATSVWDFRIGKSVLGDQRPEGQTRSRE